MRAKPDMKPWVNTYKTKRAPTRSGTFGASICRWECRPYGAQDMLIDYKPRACALGYAGVSPLQGSSTSFQSYFDALALAQLAKFTRQASFLNLRPLQNTAFARH